MDTLEELINTYQPTEQAIAMVRAMRFALLTGISGAGKNTVQNQLLNDASFRRIVSHTTRAPRINNNRPEVEGVDYYFIDEATAITMLTNHQFIEAKFVHGTVYGTSLAELTAAHDEGKIAIGDIDVQGVAEYKKIAPDHTAVFLVPPDYATWISRLKARYASEEEFQQQWPKRRASSIKELERALEVPYYHVVINDELDRAVRVTREIIARGDLFNQKDDEARLAARRLLAAILAEGPGV